MTRLRRQIPSLNALYAFEAAGRLLNFSRASEELNVTPAAVSRTMQRLEAFIGTPLFQRQGTGVSLSENGKLLHEATRRAVSQIESALVEIADRGKGADTVTLSVSTAFTTHWLMPRMTAFKAAFPQVDLRFQLLMGPLTGPVDDVDLGMRFLTGKGAGHRTFPIMPEVMVPMCSPAYREARDPAGRGDTLIKLSSGEPLSPYDLLDGVGPDQPIPLFFADYAIVLQAAMLGQGICWGWLNVVGHWMREGRLVPLGQRSHVTPRQCCLLQMADRPLRPVVEAVRAWIIEELRADYRQVQALYPALDIPDVDAWGAV